MTGCVLAVDPGRDKCGLAVVTCEGTVLAREIVATGDLPAAVSRLAATHSPQRVLMGNGTWSKRLRPLVQEALASVSGPPLGLVDEKHTTERARRLYFEHHPPAGLWRLVPLGMRVPPEPYDDFAAVVMATDFLARCHPAVMPPGHGNGPRAIMEGPAGREGADGSGERA